jgi:ACR3 family arsenite efflux pump ArsB
MFLLFILFVIIFYAVCLYLISYAVVTMALRKFTDNWYIRMFISIILAALTGYMLLCVNTGDLFDTKIKPVLSLLTLASFFYLLHNHFSKTKVKNRDM